MTCSPANESAWLRSRIEQTQDLIVAYEEAIFALASGAQHYHLDTGQSRQSVTKAQLVQLREMLSMLENRREALLNRLCGRSRVIVFPGF